jgi:hypothetical protein
MTEVKTINEIDIVLQEMQEQINQSKKDDSYNTAK